jgi:FkbM family methyltransferase
MSILRGVVSSYSLFGLNGVALLAKARLLRRSTEVYVSVSGIKHPVYARLRTSDVSLLSEMLQDVEYDLNFPVPPRVIVDAGANIGLTSVFYANKYPQARILAIEPELSNYEMLLKNAAPYENITCIRAALWKCDTKVEIADPGLGNWGFQTAAQIQTGNQVRSKEVEAITVNSMMDRFGIDHIDLFRVDIEGAEQEVFENASQWINSVRVIAIELHDWLKSGCSRSVYLATSDFHWEFRRGETVFLGKGERVINEFLPREQSDSPTSTRRMRGRRPCTIL